MIVVITPMKNCVITIVQKINSNAKVMAGVFWELGNVMEIRIVLMALMKTLLFVIIENAMMLRNSHVTMANVSQFCGNVILTMIVETTAMNQLIFAEIRIAQLDGADAPDMQIIVVFLNGCFAMAKMTAGMVLMNSMPIVHLVKKKEISVVETEDVYLNDGCVILKMIVVTILTKVKKLVPDAIANVQNLNLDATMTNVSQADGNVIMMMIAETEVMKPLVEPINVQLINSNVPLDIASKQI